MERTIEYDALFNAIPIEDRKREKKREEPEKKNIDKSLSRVSSMYGK
jgi:hypothetical protein